MIDTKRFAKIAPLIESAEVLFLSIQKAGRTWVRYFLQEYTLAATGTTISLKPRAMPKTTIFPSICFTADFFDFHDRDEEEPYSVFEAQLLAKPLILLVRDPRDLIVSYYYFARRLNPDDFKRIVPSETFDEFVSSPIYGMERIARVYKVQRDLFRRHDSEKLLLSYEDLWQNPTEHFAQLVRFLIRADPDADAFAKALGSSAFDRMQAREIEISRSGQAREFQRLGVDNWSGDTNDLKVRAGGTGSYRAFHPEWDDLARLAQRYPETASLLS